MKILPLCKKLFGTCEPMPIFGKDAEYLSVSDADEETYRKFTGTLAEEGYSLYSERHDALNFHSTYIKNLNAVNVSFTGGDKCIRVVSETADNLPPRAVDAESFDKVTSPLITQVKLMYVGADCGMSYLVRLSDGKFIMIDGGIGEHDEAEHLHSLMCEQNVLEGEPIIAAWFITHAHSDHFNMFSKFRRIFPDVMIENLVYNWPNFDMTSTPSDLTAFNERIDGLTDTKIIIPRQGNRFCYADAEIDVLFVCEEIYPDLIPNINDSSTVTRMKLGGYTFLWLGDALKQASEMLCKHYTPDELKCDFLQVGHHGYKGGSPELYATADPSYLLWPIPDYWYKRTRAWECNRFLSESENIKSVMNTGQREYVIDLTKPIPEIDAEGEYPGKHIIYCEKFNSCSPFALNWSCVRGGKTGYGGLKIEFPEKGKCKVTSDEKYSVCEVLRRGLCRNVRNYTFTICGISDAENTNIGLYTNYQKPYEWSDEEIAWISVPQGAFEIKAKASTESGSVDYFLNGNLIFSRNYEYCDDCAFHFVLRNTSLILTEIQITDDSIQ